MDLFRAISVVTSKEVRLLTVFFPHFSFFPSSIFFFPFFSFKQTEVPKLYHGVRYRNKVCIKWFQLPSSTHLYILNDGAFFFFLLVLISCLYHCRYFEVEMDTPPTTHTHILTRRERKEDVKQ